MWVKPSIDGVELKLKHIDWARNPTSEHPGSHPYGQSICFPLWLVGDRRSHKVILKSVNFFVVIYYVKNKSENQCSHSYRI